MAVKKKLHYVELYDLYNSPNIIRAIKSRRWVGHVACTKVFRVLVWKPGGKWPRGRPKRRGENIKMDLQKVEWGAWTGLIWITIRTSGGHLCMW
jgi:hypothetical protein